MVEQIFPSNSNYSPHPIPVTINLSQMACHRAHTCHHQPVTTPHETITSGNEFDSLLHGIYIFNFNDIINYAPHRHSQYVVPLGAVWQRK
jgi:hypothetical protein